MQGVSVISLGENLQLLIHLGEQIGLYISVYVRLLICFVWNRAAGLANTLDLSHEASYGFNGFYVSVRKMIFMEFD